MKTRSEAEMLSLITKFVENDKRIRVAILNGSRANPNIKKDIFQDYDISCYVTDVQPYIIENDVVTYFGETMVYEQPNLGPWPPDDADGSYHNYNMQFLDGNRLDLTFNHISRLEEDLLESLSVVLVDKDGLCTDIDPASDVNYHLSKPTYEQFKGCCDAFYFAVGSHIPKNIWRRKLTLLKFYIEGWLREPIHLMLSWEIGLKTGFDKSIGKKGIYIENYIEADTWEKYLETYVASDFDEIWDSLFKFVDIFDKSAEFVAEKYGFEYRKKTSNDVVAFLEHVRNLSEDAKTIY